MAAFPKGVGQCCNRLELGRLGISLFATAAVAALFEADFAHPNRCPRGLARSEAQARAQAQARGTEWLAAAKAAEAG